MADFARKFLPPGNEGVIQKHEELMAHLASLPVDPSGYGLIHQDVHGGNFFVADGGITLFDFDDCLYAWFMHDVAMTLFYVLPMDCSAPEDVEFARRCFGELMDGYARKTIWTAPGMWKSRISSSGGKSISILRSTAAWMWKTWIPGPLNL